MNFNLSNPLFLKRKNKNRVNPSSLNQALAPSSRKNRFYKQSLLLALFFFSTSGQAKIIINIGSAKVKKSVIALSPFLLKNNSFTEEDKKLGESMFSHLNENLKRSSYFKILPSAAFIENPIEKAPIPWPENIRGFRWENWKLSGTDFLLFNSYTISEGQVRVKVAFYNINLKKAVFQRKYSTSSQHIESLINRLSNDLVQKLSGRKGIFETKITSVKTLSNGQKELFVMNWNGIDSRRITFHRSIVLSPVWSPDGQKLAYTAFVFNKKLKKRQAILFLYDRKTRLIKILSRHQGANLGADFLSNGTGLFVTLEKGRGLMDIFKLNMFNTNISPLTNGPPGVINVEPSVNPRNNRIAFSSNRNGKAHIYTMDSTGGSVRQLTSVGHYNATPDWSPFKNKLVFSGKDGRHFDIFMMNGDGSGLRRLTHLKKSNGQRANCESPSFSPDGRFIVFTSDVTGTYQLFIMNLDDLYIERITFDNHHYKSPKWSPYL
ncbi:MAG: hypothetical protein OXB86_04070 [Bdellovibrionales bacterium]|nr:hypothetical protein [Bdellovibrionales bacterium]